MGKRSEFIDTAARHTLPWLQRRTGAASALPAGRLVFIAHALDDQAAALRRPGFIRVRCDSRAEPGPSGPSW